MRTARMVTHGLMLSIVTIGAIAVGFAVYRALGLRNQIAVQVLKRNAPNLMVAMGLALRGFD